MSNSIDWFESFHSRPKDFQTCPECGVDSSITSKACHSCGHNFHKGGKGSGGGGGGSAASGKSNVQKEVDRIGATREPNSLEKEAGITKSTVLNSRELNDVMHQASSRSGKYEGWPEDDADKAYWEADGAREQNGRNVRAMSKMYRVVQKDIQQADIQATDLKSRASYIRRHGTDTEATAQELDRKSREWTKRGAESRQKLNDIRDHVQTMAPGVKIEQVSE